MPLAPANSRASVAPRTSRGGGGFFTDGGGESGMIAGAYQVEAWREWSAGKRRGRTFPAWDS